MNKSNVSKILWEDLGEICKVSRKQLTLVSVLIGVLLFLLNTFLGVSFYAGNFSDTLKDKLGMYFYIKDTPGQESQTYTEIMTLQDELKSKHLTVMFSSKEEALTFLEKKIPNVVENFQKYGINNPLPATLYVMFRNQSQYESLKSIIIKHKDIILNIKDIDPDKTLQQQENRVLTIINFSNFIQVLSYSIIALLGIISLSFVIFLLRNMFDTFSADFKIKKIL
jgi:cell division protein FtsX